MLARVKKLTVAMTKTQTAFRYCGEHGVDEAAGRGCLRGAGIGHRAPCPEKGPSALARYPA